jgi:transcriptional regulator with XRE-family HTH domain
MSTFGERLREARKEKGLSQGALAKIVGVKQPTIAELESEGKGSSKAALIAKALGVSVLWLSEGRGAKIESKYDSDKESINTHQIEVKDFSVYSDNKVVQARLELLLNYFVVLNESQQETILQLINDMYGLTSKLNSIARRREKPLNFKDNKNDKPNTSKKA